MSIEDIKNLAATVLLVVTSAVGGMTILGFIVVSFLMIDEE
jgi:hypothetical protein